MFDVRCSSVSFPINLTASVDSGDAEPLNPELLNLQQQKG